MVLDRCLDRETARDTEFLLLNFTTAFYYRARRPRSPYRIFTTANLLLIFSTEYRVGAVLERCLERDTQHMLH